MDFTKLRRFKQAMDAEGCERILEEGSFGVMSVTGEGGYPYGVPVNYVYSEGVIYIHSAKEGHKLKAIRNNDKVSFTVVLKSDVISEKYTTAYLSVIVFGKAVEVDGYDEKLYALRALAEKYSSTEPAAGREREIARYFDKTAIIKIVPEHISGKRGLEA